MGALWAPALELHPERKTEQKSCWQILFSFGLLFVFEAVCLQVYLHSGGLPGPLSESLKAKKKESERLILIIHNMLFAIFMIFSSELTFLARAEDAGGSLSPLFLRFLSACLLPRRPVVRVMVVGVCWNVE